MDLAVSDSLIYCWRNISLRNDSLYLMEQRKFNELSLINNSLQESIKRDKFKSRKICIGVGVGGTLIGILLGVLLIK